MRFRTEIARQPVAQGFDFGIGQRRGFAAEADQLYHSGQLQHLQPVAQRDVHEYVTRKQRKLELYAPIFPATQRPIQREKAMNSPSIHLLADVFLMPGSGIGGVPSRPEIFRRTLRIHCTQNRVASPQCRQRVLQLVPLLKILPLAWHSSAPSVTDPISANLSIYNRLRHILR